MSRSVRLRALASADLEAASDHYLRDGGERVALEFIDAVEQAVGRIARSPQIGSLRFAYDADIPDLRAWAVPRFPYVVFYVAGENEIDVWRVLHTRRDIPAAMVRPDP